MKVLKTKSVEHFDLLELRDNLGIQEKDFKLLMEAYRRKHLTGRNNGIMGLGTAKEYKCKFFTLADKNNISTVSNAYVLSVKGIEIMKLIEEYLPSPQNLTEANNKRLQKIFSTI